MAEQRVDGSKRRFRSIRSVLFPWAVGLESFSIEQAAKSCDTSYGFMARKLREFRASGEIRAIDEPRVDAAGTFALTKDGQKAAAYYKEHP